MDDEDDTDSFVEALLRAILDVATCFEGPETIGAFENPELDDEGVGIGEPMLPERDKESRGGGEEARRELVKNLLGLKRFSSLEAEFTVVEQFSSDELCLEREN